MATLQHLLCILITKIYGSGSIDLKGMQAETLCNVVPPTSRSASSIALQFSDSSSGILTMDERESVSSCWFMVVFQLVLLFFSILTAMMLSLISTCFWVAYRNE